jgi:cytoskeletal protein CcmA (bactofilin family)
MFNKAKTTLSGPIGTLIGAGTVIVGELRFSGGARIDGTVKGNVIAEPGTPSSIFVSESGHIVGEVRAQQVVVNGQIEGPIEAGELLDLQPKAQISGDITYRALEIHHGAVIQGRLIHQGGEKPGLKLAVSREA